MDCTLCHGTDQKCKREGARIETTNSFPFPEEQGPRWQK